MGQWEEEIMGRYEHKPLSIDFRHHQAQESLLDFLERTLREMPGCEKKQYASRIYAQNRISIYEK